jgi:hypothetical protein
VGTERNDLLIEQYTASRWPDASSFTPKDRTAGRNISHNDLYEGIRKGASAQLDRGVGGAAQQGLLT